MAYALGVVASIGYGVIKSGERPGARFIGMTEHPNVLGITGMIGLALIPFIWSRIDAKWHWFWLSVAAVNAATVWFSGSRAALVVPMLVVLIWQVVACSFRGGTVLGLGGDGGLLVADSLIAKPGASAIAQRLGGAPPG